MSRAEDLVKSLGKKQQQREIQKQSRDEWPQCCISGCRLMATIKEDRSTCTHHHRTHGYEAECITKAIDEYKSYINKYAEMIYWSTRQWREKKAQIMGWPVLPATEFEMNNPTMYLNRLKQFIDKGIKKKAEEIYMGKE